jgi:hyaluronate lyase
MYLLNGTTWEITNANKQNVFDWVYDAFEPLIYKGSFMDLARGREIARQVSQTHTSGHKAIRAIVRLSQLAPAADATAYKKMIKYWVQNDTFKNVYGDSSIEMIDLIKQIMNDSAVTPRGELIKNNQYPRMDRAVHLRPGFGFAVSMSSNRIANYESINSENLKGWYTGDGMTYLFNNDLAQYDDHYWPTIEPYRLPGTTVDTGLTRGNASGQSYRGANNWVGGTSLIGLYGATGMELDGYGSTLAAKKSWFMFDDEIVALGSGITSTDNQTIETIVENRKINSSGNNTFMVNGASKSTALGWNETMSSVNWAHLAGNVTGSDIGYYFPGGATITGDRQSRTASWSAINTSSTHLDATPITRNYLSMRLNHGTNPSNATYSYVMLPNKTSTQVSNYASNPNIEVLQNSAQVHAVKETNLNIVAANFWSDGTQTADIITSNKKASVMTKENPDVDLEVAVADPTQANTGTITIDIAKTASSTISADSGITVLSLNPIKISVNVNGAKGKTFKVKFSLTESPATSGIIIDNGGFGYSETGTWLSSSLTGYNGSTTVYTTNAYTGGTAKWTPTIGTAGDYNVYVWYPVHAASAQNVKYTVQYNGGSTDYFVDQTQGGGAWKLLGTKNFAAGSSGYVQLTSTTQSASNPNIRVDAVRIEPAAPPIMYEAENLTTIVSTSDTQADYSDSAASGGIYNSATLNAVNDYVEYTVNVAQTGTYSVYAMDRIAGNKGMYQLSIDGINQGTAIDQYASASGFRESNLGTVTINSTGNKQFRFKVTGSNTNSSGFLLAFDYIKLVKN